MKGRRTRWYRVVLKIAVARYLLRLGNQVEACSREHRCVQHLANVAGCFRSTSVLVEKRRARSDIQQHQAAQ
jgi:hypothetical protein